MESLDTKSRLFIFLEQVMIIMKWVSMTPTMESYPEKESIDRFSRLFCIHPVLVHHLHSIGIDDEEKMRGYLYPSLNGLHDPLLLNDMKKAAVRIIQAIKRNERILIFGDYDVDGITASSLLFLGLRRFGADVSFRLPLREEGYGITPEAIEKYGIGISLIITVDNGSGAHAGMAAAKSKGIDVIVTDHHDITGEYPDCYAFVNPKRHENMYPFVGLCGAGVAFKLLQAIYGFSNVSWEKHAWDYIELVALGTIADMVPLQGENRVICYLGLRKMNTDPLPQLKIIYDLLKISKVDSSVIAFSIAPIFNAVGRISDPNTATKVFTSNNFAVDDIKLMIELNNQRRTMQSDQFEKVDNIIVANSLHCQKVIVVSEDLHPGIIGLLASNITEKYGKPAIVISNAGVGSCRSVGGTSFSMINTLKNCQSYLKKFGGHQAAAGLSIELNQIQDFADAIQLAVSEEPQAESITQYLCEMPFGSFFNEISEDIVCLEPFGLGNPKPIFLSPSASFVDFRLFGKNQQHLKFRFENCEAVAFKKATWADSLRHHRVFDFLYSHDSASKRSFIIHQLRKSEKSTIHSSIF